MPCSDEFHQVDQGNLADASFELELSTPEGTAPTSLCRKVDSNTELAQRNPRFLAHGESAGASSTLDATAHGIAGMVVGAASAVGVLTPPPEFTIVTM